MAKEFDSVAELVEWAKSLDERWPERQQVMQHICAQLTRVPFLKPNVVELCCGAGTLAEFLMRESPRVQYRGLDASASLLQFTGERLAGFGDRVVGLHQVDLNEDWLGLLPDPVHAIVSMQSLHDVGNDEAVNRVYGLAKRALTRGGLFLNADLATPERPGRMPVERHLKFLQAQGFDHVACTLEMGSFVCAVGFRGPVD